MIYRFGDYKLSTSRTLGGSWLFPQTMFKGFLYYNRGTGGLIIESKNYYSEASVIDWARQAITVHKTNLKKANDAATN